MNILVGFFIATSLVRLDPAASTGEAMSITAITTIAMIVNVLFKITPSFQ
jgi:hypothetical protein